MRDQNEIFYTLQSQKDSGEKNSSDFSREKRKEKKILLIC